MVVSLFSLKSESMGGGEDFSGLRKEDEGAAVESRSVSWLGKQSLGQKTLSQFAPWEKGFLPNTCCFVWVKGGKRAKKYFFSSFNTKCRT